MTGNRGQSLSQSSSTRALAQAVPFTLRPFLLYWCLNSSFITLPSARSSSPASWPGPFQTPGAGFSSKLLMLLVPPNLNQAGGGHIPCLTNLWVLQGSTGGSDREPGEGGQTHLVPGWTWPGPFSPPTQGLGSTAVNESVAASPSPHPAAPPQLPAHLRSLIIVGGEG